MFTHKILHLNKALFELNKNLASHNQINLVLGNKYNLGYRIYNSLGYSDWSYIFALEYIQVTSKPLKPVFVTLDNQKVNVEIYQSLYDGGSKIVNYTIYIPNIDSNNRIVTY